MTFVLGQRRLAREVLARSSRCRTTASQTLPSLKLNMNGVMSAFSIAHSGEAADSGSSTKTSSTAPGSAVALRRYADGFIRRSVGVDQLLGFHRQRAREGNEIRLRQQCVELGHRVTAFGDLTQQLGGNAPVQAADDLLCACCLSAARALPGARDWRRRQGE